MAAELAKPKLDWVPLEGLYARAFPGLTEIEQKHRVSMLRAARSVSRFTGRTWILNTRRRPAEMVRGLLSPSEKRKLERTVRRIVGTITPN